MNRVLTEQLIYEILSVVEEIPEGCVASYGQIARLIGRENNARLVGTVLSRVGIPSQLSLPPGRKFRRAHYARLARTACSSFVRGSGIQRKRLR